MRSAVRYAVNYPQRLEAKGECLDFTRIGSLTFHEPDRETFPLLDAARSALTRGGTAPAALIAADEEAVQAFIDGRISFCGIAEVVCNVMETMKVTSEITRESLEQTDAETRNNAGRLISKMAN